MIRPAQDRELDDLVDLWLRASCKAHNFVPFDFWQAQAHDMRHLYLPRAEILVCETGGAIAGFVALLEGYIAALFVDPELQGQGVGRALLQFVQARHRQLELAVFTDNAHAIRFYEAGGFRVVAEQVDALTGRREKVMRWVRER